MVDESLEFRLLLTDRWHDPYGWRYFPQGRYIIYTLGALHVLLSVLRLVAYLVLEFPLMYLADDEDDDDADVNVGTAKVDKKNARHRTTSVLKKVHTYVHIHTYTHTYTHTYIHTHTRGMHGMTRRWTWTSDVECLKDVGARSTTRLQTVKWSSRHTTKQ